MRGDNWCVILPCAGEGRRLGLDLPKELYRLDDRVRLIDLSLKHVLAGLSATGDRILRVCVVVTPGKENVHRYVARCLPSGMTRLVYFNSRYQEWPGSVFSAHPHYEEKNLVLLPDSFLGLGGQQYWHRPDGKPLVELARRALQRRPVFFGYREVKRKRSLRQLGALRVDGDEVVRMQDKPRQDLQEYNACWGCYGFRRRWGRELYRLLIASVLHQPVNYSASSFFPAGAVALAEYQDLGTWPAIRSFRSARKSTLAGFSLTGS